MSKTVAKLNTGKLGTTSTSNPASAFTPKKGQSYVPAEDPEKKRRKASLDQQSESLSNLRAERARLRLKDLTSNGGTGSLGGSVGLGASTKNNARIAELDRQIKKADEKLAADEADYYGYVKAGDNMYSEADAAIANLPRRLSKTVKGAAQQVETAGLETAGQIRQQASLDNGPDTIGFLQQDTVNKAREAENRQKAREDAARLFQKSDEIGYKAAETLDEAKGGLKAGGKVLVDLGSEGLKLAGDMVLNTALPGSGLGAMAVRAFGSGAQEARQSGATADEQFLYGLASAGVELATEKLFSSNALTRKAYGKGWLNSTGLGDALDNGISRIVKDPTARLLATNFIEEGSEEILSDVFNPAIRMIYDRDAMRTTYGTSEGRKQLFHDMLYDGFIGGALGAIGATGNVVQMRVTGQKTLDEKSANYKLMQAEAFPVGSETRQMLEPLLEKVNKVGEPTAMEMGRLIHAMQSDYDKGLTPDARRVTLKVDYDKNGNLTAERVMGAPELALYESGMSAEEAFAQGAILRDLALDVNSVSNKQLKNDIDLSDPAVKAAFEELLGETVTIPANASKAQLARAYRKAAEDHNAKIEAQKKALQEALDAINDRETAVQQAIAENDQKAQAEAQKVMDGVMEQVDANTAEAQSQEGNAPVATGVQTREEWFRDTVEKFRRERGRDPKPEELEKGWFWQTGKDGILLDNGQTIGREEFFQRMRESQDDDAMQGMPYTDEDLEAQYQYYRLVSRQNPLPSGEVIAAEATESSETNPTEAAPATPVETEVTMEAGEATAPVEEGEGQMSFDDMKFAVNEEERPDQKVVTTGPKVNHDQAWTAALLQKKLTTKGIKKIIFDGENMSDDDKAHVLDGVIYLNERVLTTGKEIWWAVGHEITHPATEADAEISDKIISAMQALDKKGAFNNRKGEDASKVRAILADVDAAIKKRMDGYYQFYRKHGVAEDRAKELASYDEMKVEVANDLMGYVFSNQDTIERMLGEEPDLITKAIRAVSRFRSGTDLLKGGVNYSAAAKELDALADRLTEALGKYRDTQAEKQRLDKVTKRGYNKNRSPEMETMIKRLSDGEQVPVEEVEAIPEVAEVLNRPILETINDNSAERKALRKRIVDRIWASGSYDEASAKKAKDNNAPEVDKYTGPVKQGRRADLILGVPAAGKSSVLVDPISKEHQSRVLDADMAKELLPEFDDGKGARNVHEESSMLRNEVLDRALDRGDNIVWPMVGDSLEGVIKKVQQLKKEGYEVHVHLNELDAHKAMGRALARFTGKKPRFVAPELVLKAGNKPSENYEIIKGMEGLISGYSKYSNDVAKGTLAKLIESSDMGRGAQEYDAGADGGVARRGRESLQDVRGTERATQEGEEVNGTELQNDDGSGSYEAGQAGAPDVREGRGVYQSELSEEPGSVSQEGRSDQESGRRLPQLPRLVRLNPASKAKISDSGATPVDVSDNTTDYAAFSSALDAAKAADPEHGWAVTPQTAEELEGKNGITIMAKDGGSGVFVTEDGDIEGVFRNQQTGTPKALRTLLPLAIEAGGRKLDCYGEKLARQYAQAGFVPVAKTTFNPEFANEGWTPDKGKPDIYFMMYVGPTTQDEILNNYGKHPVLTDEQLDALPTLDYDEAMNLRDQKLSEAQAAQSIEGKKFAITEPVPGLYNKSEKIIEKLPEGKIGVGQLMKKLTGGGVNADELKWLGINDFVKGKKSVDRDEILDLIKANDLQMEETILSSDHTGPDADTPLMDAETGEAYDPTRETNWNEYTTLGGHNYREMLFKVPGSQYSNQSSELHWRDRAAGTVAHARVSDFVDALGRSVLFVDEIQSDWHNEGKRYGYQEGPETEESVRSRVEKKQAATDARNRVVHAFEDLRGAVDKFFDDTDQDEWFRDSIRNAYGSGYAFRNFVEQKAVEPFLQNNPTDATKKATLESVYKDIIGDNYDYLSSDARSQIWDLAYDISTLGHEFMQAKQEQKAAEAAETANSVPEAPFANSYVNFALKRLIRDAAERGMDGIAWTTGQMQADRWADTYLTAYENEYDREIPNDLNKLGKEFGSKVGRTQIQTGDGLITVPYFPITPEMRVSVFENGMPKFAVDMPIEEQVHNALTKRNARENYYVYYGITTPLMKAIGIQPKDAPNLMGSSKMRQAHAKATPYDDKAHGVPQELLEHVQDYLERPVMAIDTQSQETNYYGRPNWENNVLFVTDYLDDNGFPYVIAVRAFVKPDGRVAWNDIDVGSLGEYMNNIMSVYSLGPKNSQVALARAHGPNNFVNGQYTGKSFTRYMEEAMRADDILYVNSERLESLMKKAEEWRAEHNKPTTAETDKTNPANAFTPAEEAPYIDNWVKLPKGFDKIRKDIVLHQSRNMVGDEEWRAKKKAEARAANPNYGKSAKQIALEKAFLDKQAKENAEREKANAEREQAISSRVQALATDFDALKELGIDPYELNIDGDSQDTLNDLSYILESANGVRADPESYPAEEFAEVLNNFSANYPEAIKNLESAATPGSNEAEMLDFLNESQIDSLLPELQFLSEQVSSDVGNAKHALDLEDNRASVFQPAQRTNEADERTRYALDLDTTPPWLSEVLRRERDLSNDTEFQGFMRDFYSGFGSANPQEPITQAAPRVSDVRTNSFQNMGVPMQFTEQHRKALEEANYEYDPIAEQESMRRAEARLNADYDGEKAKLEKANSWTGEDLDAAMGILAAELKKAQQTGNYDEATEWTHIIQEQGTRGGQFVQAFAKYNRSPEGIIVRAAEDLAQSTLSGEEQQRLLDQITSFANELNKLRPDAKGNTVDPNALVDLIVAQAKQRKTPVHKATLNAIRKQVTRGEIQYLYDFALTQLDQIAKDYVPNSLGKKAATFQTLMHLLNLKTGMRNLVSNEVFGGLAAAANDISMIPDLALSLMTGNRTVGFDAWYFSKDAQRDMKARGERSRMEVALDVNPETNARDKYGTSRRTWKMAGNRGVVSDLAAKGMSSLEKAMAYELNWTDEMRKGGVHGEIVRGLAPLVANGTLTMEQAEAWAQQEMLYRTFQDDTYMNKLLSGIKRVLNTKLVREYDANGNVQIKLGQADFGLGDIVQKYTQVPGALITRAVEFAPTGYIKAVYNLARLAKQSDVAKKATARSEAAAKAAEGSDRTRLKNAAARAFRSAQIENAKAMSMQREASLALGRAMTGTGLITLFAMMAKAGLLHRDDDDQDADVKALRGAEGISGTQLNYSALQRLATGGSAEWQNGDVLMSVDFLEPVNNLLTMGTKIANTIEGDPDSDVWDYTLDTADALWQTMQEIPTMQTLRTAMQTAQYHKEDSALPVWAEIPIEIARSGATGFVWAPVRQTAQAIDPFYRDAYTSNELGQQTVDTLKNAIPGLRQQLPEKLDNFGQPKKQENQPLNALNAFIIPGQVRTFNQSEVSKELSNLYKKTGSANVFPDRNAPYTLKSDSEENPFNVQLDGEERTTYQQTRGTFTFDQMERARNSWFYQSASTKQKAEIAANVKNVANYVAKVQALSKQGIVYSDKKYDNVITAINLGYDAAGYYVVKDKCDSFTADKDANGKSISGSKMEKIIEYLSGLPLTDAQKAYMFEKTSGSNKTPFGSY